MEAFGCEESRCERVFVQAKFRCGVPECFCSVSSYNSAILWLGLHLKSFSPYPFQPLVVSLSGVSRIRQLVCHWAMVWRSSSGKSEPQSTTHPTDCDWGGGENMRAPTAEYDPAPPRIPSTGGFGGGKWISSTIHR